MKRSVSSILFVCVLSILFVFGSAVAETDRAAPVLSLTDIEGAIDEACQCDTEVEESVDDGEESSAPESRGKCIRFISKLVSASKVLEFLGLVETDFSMRDLVKEKKRECKQAQKEEKRQKKDKGKNRKPGSDDGDSGEEGGEDSERPKKEKPNKEKPSEGGENGDDDRKEGEQGESPGNTEPR